MPSNTLDWTKDQENCIHAKGGTVLVSAAAGSGKTAVLIERVARILTDSENKVYANQLLIVTFTKAATAEMRSRLSEKMDELLELEPNNQHLQKQKMLLPSANICTIDAFCGNLVREHFDTLDIVPDFRLLDENEGKILKQDAVATVVEEFYAAGKDDFKKLVELLFAGRDDSNLEETILKLYDYSRAYANPTEWLTKQSLSLYTGALAEDAKAILKENCHLLFHYVGQLAADGIATLDANPETAVSPARDILSCEQEMVLQLEGQCNEEDFDGLSTELKNYDWPKWSAGKGLAKAEEVRFAKACRDQLKEALTKQLPKLLSTTMEEYKADCETLRPLAAILIEAVLRFSEEYKKLKQEAYALDFSDVELLALSLLLKDPGKTLEKTPLAEELSKTYHEILIDEYQDTNQAQDALFAALSKEETNLFMVGDVKQSIYRFRQAMPELFLEKKERFAPYNEDHPVFPSTITLGENFRSRKGITGAVNFTMEQLMSKPVGEIVYDESEALVYGNKDYQEADFAETEFLLFEKDTESSAREKEAKFVANYILEELRKNPQLHYKDFTILFQYPGSVAATYEQALTDAGIPVYAGATGGFFHTPDMQLILSFLRIIDNPLQDVPLVACLLSPLFGFTETELAALRTENRYQSFFALLLRKQDENEKVAHFLEALQHYRRLSVSMPSGALIRQIYRDFSYPDLVSAKPGGARREANLRQLLRFAEDYDNHSNYGLAGFLRYLGNMETSGIDPEAGTTLSENADVVRIMSIHKSKGLQFTYCILPDLNHKFNFSDEQSSLILHPGLGIGLKGRDFSSGATYPTLMHSIVQQATSRATMSEFLRLLYVAMTRAKEHLVLVGTLSSKTEDYISKKGQCLTTNPAIHPFVVKSQNTMLDWIMLAFLRHPALEPVRQYSDFRIPLLASDVPLSFRLLSPGEEPEVKSKAEAVSVDPDPAFVEELTQRIAYEYPYAPLANTLTKRAASDHTNGQFDTRFFAKAQPEFQSEKGLTPAQRGTCLHKYMQYADFLNAAKDPETELDRLLSLHFFTTTEAGVIDLEKVKTFFSSDLYRRMEQSPKLYREKKFSILEPAGTFNPDLPEPLASEQVLIQGIVDCAFEEDGKLIVVDYKTDRIKDPDRFVDCYQSQLQTYCNALAKCTGMEIGGAYLYSFQLGMEIPIPLA